MAVTGTKTVRDLVTAGLRKSRILAFGENATADEADEARDELERMLKGWQNAGYHLWTKTSASLSLTTAASYTLSPIRPMRVLSARYKATAAGNEIPMIEMTRLEYDELPNKSSTGTPTQFYYDRQREAALLYVWPVLASASAQTIEYTYDREIEDIGGLTDVVDVPGEWWDAVVYNLASRLQDTIPMTGNSPITPARAEALLQDAEGFDHAEGSVWMRDYSY